VGFIGEIGISSKDVVFLEDQILEDIKDKGEKSSFYYGSEVISDSFDLTLASHSERERQVQENADGDKAPKEDTDHGDTGVKPLPVTAETDSSIIEI